MGLITFLSTLITAFRRLTVCNRRSALLRSDNDIDLIGKIANSCLLGRGKAADIYFGDFLLCCSFGCGFGLCYGSSYCGYQLCP